LSRAFFLDNLYVRLLKTKGQFFLSKIATSSNCHGFLEIAL